SMAFSLTIGSATLSITTPSPLPSGLVGLPYSQTILASGGTSPYTYSVTSGALPGGVTLSAAGGLAGIATVAGTFTFTIQATDSASSSVSKPFSVTIGSGGFAVATAALPNGAIGVAYSQALSGIGGTTPYRYAVIGGSLPTGITLNSAGILSGTPTANGTSSFTVQITD